MNLPAPHVRKRADQYAAETATAIGGKVVAGSGSGIHKGDVDAAVNRSPRNWVPKIEEKFTDKQSISLKLDWIAKITDEALAAGRQPVVLLRFVAAQAPCKEEYILLEATAFYGLYHAAARYGSLVDINEPR